MLESSSVLSLVHTNPKVTDFKYQQINLNLIHATFVNFTPLVGSDKTNQDYRSTQNSDPHRGISISMRNLCDQVNSAAWPGAGEDL